MKAEEAIDGERTDKEEEEKGISNQTEKSLFRREEKGKDESGERRRRSGKKVHIRKRLIAKEEEEEEEDRCRREAFSTFLLFSVFKDGGFPFFLGKVAYCSGPLPVYRHSPFLYL